jgi:hypothetical protein
MQHLPVAASEPVSDPCGWDNLAKFQQFSLGIEALFDKFIVDSPQLEKVVANQRTFNKRPLALLACNNAFAYQMRHCLPSSDPADAESFRKLGLGRNSITGAVCAFGDSLSELVRDLAVHCHAAFPL